MKIQELVVLSRRILVNSLVCFLIIVVLGGGQVLCHEKRVVKKSGASVEVHTYKEISEASEPCIPAQCEWWKQLHQAGNDLQRKGDEKSKRRFALLLLEGLEKSYRIPVKDGPPQTLAFGRVAKSHRVGPSKINGKVVLSVEFRADGSVGEVRVIEGLGSDIDERFIQAVRQNLFLPAIRDGAFVTDWRNTEYTLWARR